MFYNIIMLSWGRKIKRVFFFFFGCVCGLNERIEFECERFRYNDVVVY